MQWDGEGFEKLHEARGTSCTPEGGTGPLGRRNDSPGASPRVVQWGRLGGDPAAMPLHFDASVGHSPAGRRPSSLSQGAQKKAIRGLTEALPAPDAPIRAPETALPSHDPRGNRNTTCVAGDVGSAQRKSTTTSAQRPPGGGGGRHGPRRTGNGPGIHGSGATGVGAGLRGRAGRAGATASGGPAGSGVGFVVKARAAPGRRRGGTLGHVCVMGADQRLVKGPGHFLPDQRALHNGAWRASAMRRARPRHRPTTTEEALGGGGAGRGGRRRRAGGCRSGCWHNCLKRLATSRNSRAPPSLNWSPDWCHRAVQMTTTMTTASSNISAISSNVFSSLFVHASKLSCALGSMAAFLNIKPSNT